MNDQIKKYEGIVDVEEKDIPEVISNCYMQIVNVDKKIREAEQNCQIALQTATTQIFAKSINPNKAINSTQDAVRSVAQSQISITEAQRKLFENQEKMAYAMRYLLMLGASSIAMNKKVISELEAKMKEAETGELSNEAANELKEVIQFLKEQESALLKQQRLADQLTNIKETLVQYGEEITDLHKADNEQIKKYTGQEKRISAIEDKNNIQDSELENLRKLLYIAIAAGIAGIALAIIAILI